MAAFAMTGLRTCCGIPSAPVTSLGGGGGEVGTHVRSRPPNYTPPLFKEIFGEKTPFLCEIKEI